MKQTVLITGASSGLGRAFATRFAEEGYDLVLTARNEALLQEAKTALETAYPVRVEVIANDLAQPSAPEDLLAAVKERGMSVDILVNNAGLGDFGTFADSDYQKQRAMIDLNVTALVHLTYAVQPEMRQRGSGKILNVASIAAFQSGPFMSVYYATKAFVLSFSEAIAYELKGSGVTVTTLCPGPIDTGFVQAADLEKSKLFRSLPVATAQAVADHGYKAVMKGKAVSVHGLLNKLLVFSVRLAPRSLVSKTIDRIQGVYLPKS